MNVFAISLPMPPSANNMFANVIIKGKQRRIISRDYKAWREDVGGKIADAWDRQGRPCFEPHISLTIALGLNYRGDISNRIKAIEDALGESIPGFPDDRWIDRIEIERVPGIDGARILIQQGAKPDARPIGEIIAPIVADITRKATGEAA